MALNTEEVRKIADLARLRLTAEESETFVHQLSRIVEYIDQLGGYEAVGGSDGGCGFELPPVEAADEPREGLSIEDFLFNAPQAMESFLVVPQVRDQAKEDDA